MVLGSVEGEPAGREEERATVMKGKWRIAMRYLEGLLKKAGADMEFPQVFASVYRTKATQTPAKHKSLLP